MGNKYSSSTQQLRLLPLQERHGAAVRHPSTSCDADAGNMTLQEHVSRVWGRYCAGINHLSDQDTLKGDESIRYHHVKRNYSRVRWENASESSAWSLNNGRHKADTDGGCGPNRTWGNETEAELGQINGSICHKHLLPVVSLTSSSAAAGRSSHTSHIYIC